MITRSRDPVEASAYFGRKSMIKFRGRVCLCMPWLRMYFGWRTTDLEAVSGMSVYRIRKAENEDKIPLLDALGMREIFREWADYTMESNPCSPLVVEMLIGDWYHKTPDKYNAVARKLERYFEEKYRTWNAAPMSEKGEFSERIRAEIDTWLYTDVKRAELDSKNLNNRKKGENK